MTSATEIRQFSFEHLLRRLCEKKSRNMEDKDANCRLRYGLNIHCLAEIFQYLDSVDLHTLGGMNNFYKKIINDLVIPKHEINFEYLRKEKIKLPDVFERFGSNIRKFNFIDNGSKHSVEQLIELITQNCAANQLKSAEIECGFRDGVRLNLPIQFRNVNKLQLRRTLHGGRVLLSAELSEFLRYLRLEDISLDSNFDWTKLTNVTELYLKKVRGLDAKNFIELLHHRPGLEVYHHDELDTFGGSIQDICKTVAQYCGDKIRNYCGVLPLNGGSSRLHSYDFISNFKNVKQVCLKTHQVCGGDLVNAMKKLAENDTVEMMNINYSMADWFVLPNVNCIFQLGQHSEYLDMKEFGHLKTLKIMWKGCSGEFQNSEECYSFKFLSIYAPQILWNVRNLEIDTVAYNWNFITYATKLRQLKLLVDNISGIQAARILLALKVIIQKRRGGSIRRDFIRIKFLKRCVFELFAVMNDRTDCIVLRMEQRRDDTNYF